MSNELVPHNLPAGQWEMIREDIMHPRDRQRCDLIRNRHTGIYVTTDGDSLRSIDQKAARLGVAGYLK